MTTAWVVVGVLAVVVVVLVVRSARKPKKDEPPAGVRPTMEDLSAVLRNSLREVGDANQRCLHARGDEAVSAWRDLHTVLQTSVDALNGLLGDNPSPRLRRMVRLTTEELWVVSERQLNAHLPTTTEDMAAMQRALWGRAESALAAHQEMGDQATRERLLRLPDEVDASVAALEGGAASERQILMWRLAAEEIRKFVDDALARPGQQT